MRISVTLLTIIASVGAANTLQGIPCNTRGERCGGMGYGDCCEGLACTVSAVATTHTSIARMILIRLSIIGAKHSSRALPLVENARGIIVYK